LHRGCKMFGESCKLFFLSREREHSPHHWFSPFMWGSQKEKDIKFFLSSTALLLPTDWRSQPDITDSGCLWRESIIRSSQAVESINCSTRL
jgi:hypothetical protein